MGVQATVVFTDLHGSTAVFEALGNATATAKVTQITSGIAQLFEQHGGRVVKMLGDGVLALFPDNTTAIHASVELQRRRSREIVRTPLDIPMPVRVGLASGEVEIVDGDCYGDAVNVASRLCDLCGPEQIWANAPSLSDVSEFEGVTFRILGPINIRGRAEACTVYQIEWHDEESSEFLTQQGTTDLAILSGELDPLGCEIVLSWRGLTKHFHSFDMPIHIGRVQGVEFPVIDPRVSRTHARLEWRNGSVVLVDLSTYGTWVLFSGVSGSGVLLRRDECVLHGVGDLALGASFADPAVPTVHFQIV